MIKIQKKILYLIILFLVLVSLFFQLRTEKLILPPINSFKLILDYKGKTIELNDKEKNELYEILQEIKFAWRPLERTPDRFISGDTISVLAREEYSLNIVACPNEDTLNGLKHYAYIRNYKGINDFDRIIVNNKDLLDYLNKIIK